MNKLIQIFYLTIYITLFLNACSQQEIAGESPVVPPIPNQTKTIYPKSKTSFCTPYQNAVKNGELTVSVGDKLIELSSCRKSKNLSIITGDASELTSHCQKILSCIE